MGHFVMKHENDNTTSSGDNEKKKKGDVITQTTLYSSVSYASVK